MGKKIVAMILAGGKGTRLYQLTRKNAKPAVSFGGKYRIIDYALSNCSHSGIDTVGILTQYESINLSTYIGNGDKWGINGVRSTTVALPPRQTEEGSKWFNGTADAITQNLDFLENFEPEHVLILSGDHIYTMNYNEMLEEHIANDADLTISVLDVSLEEAKRFGIMSVDENNNITKFEEKPRNPKSTLASMGIYIFKYKTLKQVLIADAKDETSEHDFGKNIIPMLLEKKRKVIAYQYEGYWKDVGTISSLWEANMDLIDNNDEFYCENEQTTRVFSEDTHSFPQYVGKHGKIINSIINQGANILGHVDHSVISNEVLIEKYTHVKNCVVLPGVIIRKGAVIHNAIIINDIEIEEGRQINVDGKEIVLVTK